MAINVRLCADSYRAHSAGRAGRRTRWTPPEDVTATIAAMNRGDEAALKAWTLQHRHLC